MSSVLYIHATSSNAPIWELHLRMSITADSVLSNQMEPYYSFYQPHGGPRCGSTVKPWIARNLFYEGSARGSNVSNKFNPDKQAMSCDTRRMRCHMITTEPMVLLSLSLSLSLSLTVGLWVIVSHAWMLGLRPWRLAEIRDFSARWKVPVTGTRVFFVTSKHLWTVLCFCIQEWP